MTVTLDLSALDVPRSNGELVFDAPWQGRIFGLVVSLCESGLFAWDEFKAHLIREIGTADEEVNCDPAVYYRQFAAAFAAMMTERGQLDAFEFDARTLIEQENLAHDDHEGHDHEH
ncbi:hypothetical protein GCM10022223_53610 [Kineosporia mesophila]|uniref:Nitrile hydratase beta subunit-like N-terminal domain-containing protein n=1 Tax=Kineosporia mesophila TaxID=566012 RepID=A0ABP7ACR6_9ACTN|nr:nitrile hydratase accessory protein [Kineosporia mesophila]MCD5351258.1 nitrile hydratase accessory protein [Kineosporia mesophila]